MRLLIDANILIDVLSEREPFFHDSALVWKLCETQNVKGFVSVLSFANIAYIMRKELKAETIEKVFQMMKLIFQFTDLNLIDISNATAMKWNDFEDALQSSTAERICADYIITRNVRDFKLSKVTALTPAEYLTRYYNL